MALARALLHDPEVLILDEPTSNMDKATESLLRTRLAKLVEGKTLVLITHRASLLALVNRLIIIDNGRVVADGPRDEVLEAINSQKSHKHKPSSTATGDRKHADKADKNTGQTAGEGKNPGVEKLAPTSPTVPSESSFKGGIRGAA